MRRRGSDAHPLQLLQIDRRGVPPFLKVRGWGVGLELGLCPASELVPYCHHAAAASVHADVLGADIMATECAAQRLVGAGDGGTMDVIAWCAFHQKEAVGGEELVAEGLALQILQLDAEGHILPAHVVMVRVIALEVLTG